MKKLFCLIVLIAVCFTSCGYVEATPSASAQQEQAQKKNLTSAVTAYPTPQVNNFVERKIPLTIDNNEVGGFMVCILAMNCSHIGVALCGRKYIGHLKFI